MYSLESQRLGCIRQLAVVQHLVLEAAELLDNLLALGLLLGVVRARDGLVDVVHGASLAEQW